VEQVNNKQRTPNLFTAKELDEEIKLYYYGARYYDPRISLWISPDPALPRFLSTGDQQRDANLPGMGGLYNSQNLGLYTYTHQNPGTFQTLGNVPLTFRFILVLNFLTAVVICCMGKIVGCLFSYSFVFFRLSFLICFGAFTGSHYPLFPVK